MSHIAKENVDINMRMNNMSIGCANTKKTNSDSSFESKRQGAKLKNGEKRYNKLSNSARDRPGSNGNIVKMARKSSGNHFMKSRTTTTFSRQLDTRAVHNENNRNKYPHMPSKFHIHVADQDLEVCRQTAIRLNDVRESITVDPLLANHLSHLVFVSNQYLFDQQRSMFFFNEQLKQVEIARWLSSKTAEEQQEYIERMRLDPSALCGKFV